jgi:hypothetical protein
VEWQTRLDFEALVLGTAEDQAASATYFIGRYEPPAAIANEDK